MGALLSKLVASSARRLLAFAVLAVLLHPRVRRKVLRRFGLAPPPGHIRPLSCRNVPGFFVTLSHGATHYRDSAIPTGTRDMVPSSGVTGLAAPRVARLPHGERCNVILIHGFSTPSHLWERVFTEVSRLGHRVITYDLWGRGWSDAPSGHQTPSLFVSQLADLLFSLDVDTRRPLVLVGLSMGAVVAVEFAARFPDKAELTLRLTDPGLELGLKADIVCGSCVGDVVFHVRGAKMLSNYQEQFKDETARRTYADLFYDRFQANHANHPGYTRSLLSTLRHTMQHIREPVFRVVGAHQRPLTVVWGTKDTVTPYSGSEKLMGLMKYGKLIPIEGGSHWAVLENHSVAVDAILGTAAAAVEAYGESVRRSHRRHGHRRRHHSRSSEGDGGGDGGEEESKAGAVDDDGAAPGAGGAAAGHTGALDHDGEA